MIVCFLLSTCRTVEFASCNIKNPGQSTREQAVSVFNLVTSFCFIACNSVLDCATPAVHYDSCASDLFLKTGTVPVCCKTCRKERCDWQ